MGGGQPDPMALLAALKKSRTKGKHKKHGKKRGKK